MDKIKILWADDEIDLLKPHIIFLNEKGFHVDITNSGDEALNMLKKEYFDIIFLDENMPGLSGLDTLNFIKNNHPGIPVVMITKNETEHVMEEAIGSNIADYLIKPVKPNQILLCLKKIFENKELISKKTISDYQQEFRNIGMAINEGLDFKGWSDIYKKIVFWELELERSKDESMEEVLNLQKQEANHTFCKYFEAHYPDWINGKTEKKPVFSHTLFKEKINPLFNDNTPLFIIVIDNFRYDQWKAVQPIIENKYRVEKDELFLSILPSATHYSRNAFFAGLLPSEIEKKYPQLWLNEDDEGSKNIYEESLLAEQLKRLGKEDIKWKYSKILGLDAAKRYMDTLPNLLSNKLNVLVYNFVDMLSHARTEMEIIRELASDEKAYRSLTVSWFEHSILMEVINFLAENKVNIVITTDHGSVQVKNPVRVVGERSTNSNLRYKIGKSLQYNKKEIYEIKNPQDVYLPKANVSSSYIFCRENDFFVYPNNQNHFSNYYKDTFQHGGISIEELMIPFIFLKAK